MTPWSASRELHHRPAPRARGDDPLLKHVCDAGNKLLPAHAGMTPTMTVTTEQTPAAPRARGDDPVEVTLRKLLYSCSPRTRG